MRYTKAFKAEQQHWASNVRCLFAACGAQTVRDRLGYEIALQTRVGTYHAIVYPGTSHTELGWVAGHFDDVEKAVKLLGSDFDVPGTVNKFSGKWNHHFFSDWKVEDAVVEMKRQLRKIL